MGGFVGFPGGHGSEIGRGDEAGRFERAAAQGGKCGVMIGHQVVHEIARRAALGHPVADPFG